MLKSLPQLASSYLNVQNIYPSNLAEQLPYEENSSSYSDIVLAGYYMSPNMPESDRVNRLVDAEINLAQKLADLPFFYSERLNLSAYFGFGFYSNHPSTLNSINLRGHSNLFEHHVKDKAITVKIYADLLTSELRESEKYWREHFLLAYHYAFPNPSIIEKYGYQLKIVKDGNSTFIVGQDKRVNCMEWRSRFLDDIAPEMKRKLEFARSMIVKITNKLLESGEIMFFAHCCALEEHKKCSIRSGLGSGSRSNLQGNSQDAFFDKVLFDQLSEYPTLTLSKTFEVRKIFQ